MKANLKTYFWRLLFSLFLLFFLLRFVHLKDLPQLLKNLCWPYLLGYFGFLVADRFIMAYKWKILLDSKGVSSSWMELTAIYFKGTFIGNLLPTSLGGDTIRAYELLKKAQTGVDVISSIMMERFLGFLSSALMALLVIPFMFFFVPDFPKALLLLLAGFLASGIFFLILIMSESGTVLADRVLVRFSWAEKIRQIGASFVHYRHHPRVLWRFFLWSFGEQLLPILTIFFLALALGLSIPLYYLVFIIPIAQFFARIPISLSGFGIQEGLFITLFSFFGISTTVAFALGFASNLGNVLSGFPGAYFYLKRPPDPQLPSGIREQS
jgi:glycosyltransferase 2 family protein